VFVLLVSFDIPVELAYVLLVKLDILLDTFKQHLPNTLFQFEVGEMEIDEMHV
jgi:hypothetical protein